LIVALQPTNTFKLPTRRNVLPGKRRTNILDVSSSRSLAAAEVEKATSSSQPLKYSEQQNWTLGRLEHVNFLKNRDVLEMQNVINFSSSLALEKKLELS
jgi:hypothetical protein